MCVCVWPSEGPQCCWFTRWICEEEQVRYRSRSRRLGRRVSSVSSLQTLLQRFRPSPLPPRPLSVFVLFLICFHSFCLLPTFLCCSGGKMPRKSIQELNQPENHFCSVTQLGAASVGARLENMLFYTTLRLLSFHRTL